MPINPASKKKIDEKLKEKILEQEAKTEIYSTKFSKIEDQVRKALSDRQTDKALSDLTFWALYLGVSDIHYEVYEKDVIIRFRIDWILVNIFHLSKWEYKSILERLKYSANLKLNINDVPQDGKYDLKIKLKNNAPDKKIDVRVSTLPTKYWENVVSRLLDSSKTIVDFEDLGFYWTSKRIINKAISKNNWMILVTWPTGSWKTTTLYTILNKINNPDKKIITLEDPIEYELPWVIQAEVDEESNFTFENGLKSLLRQDPDIIMVWEIRWKETLDTATWASLTWHLVLSTLHTKSAAETLDRIINMWLKPYIIASALDTIIAQRLVRKICTHCKIEREKNHWDIAMIKSMMQEVWMKWLPIEHMKLYVWKWCDKCNNSWFLWRIWLFEIITINDILRDFIRQGASSEDIVNAARDSDLILMKEDWILKALKGYTTLEEILRVV
jgi:type II secretory ATPase GspE/PulE/Tfp pilus assembly ATPase PilB-like protein